ncbi:hypothetical protein [Autumnicola musiva]|uniref:Uncharacterized protein n=1 Tax=Autumnicola musiva TaxID=3075589 RepID=A0ABU3DBC0_9FLAO|nr:hypothetical protein [Zunongwangia sp. F117]MDT0678817.1 hypothetical protein [Zunongwangia sp. F117]
MNKLRRFLTIFTIVLVIALLIPTAFFIFQFSEMEISKNIQNWGNFADFFGGVFNPILAIANLVIFVKLTLIVAEMEDKSTKQALNQEKKILTSGLMHDSIKELSVVLNSLGEKIIINKEKSDWEILQVQQTVITFGNNYKYLFSNIDNQIVIDDLNEMLNITRKQPYGQQKFANAFNNFLNSKDEFIQSLHKQTLSKLDY